MGLKERFDKYEDEYINFDLVENKLSKRRDLHAFLLLDSLQPEDIAMNGNIYVGKVITAGSHEQIWLFADLDRLDKVITDEQILELVRCGVGYDDEYESLYMFP